MAPQKIYGMGYISQGGAAYEKYAKYARIWVSAKTDDFCVEAAREGGSLQEPAYREWLHGSKLCKVIEILQSLEPFWKKNAKKTAKKHLFLMR